MSSYTSHLIAKTERKSDEKAKWPRSLCKSESFTCDQLQMSWWVCAHPIPKLSVMVAGKRSRTLAEQLSLQWMIGILLILRKLFLTTLHSQVLQIKPTLCLPTLPCFYPTTSVLLLTGVWYFWQSHMKLMGFIVYIALCFVGETCLNL